MPVKPARITLSNMLSPSFRLFQVHLGNQHLLVEVYVVDHIDYRRGRTLNDLQQWFTIAHVLPQWLYIDIGSGHDRVSGPA
jgi:hypothetical protein